MKLVPFLITTGISNYNLPIQFCGTLSWICTYAQMAKIIYIILKDLIYGTSKNQFGVGVTLPLHTCQPVAIANFRMHDWSSRQKIKVLISQRFDWTQHSLDCKSGMQFHATQDLGGLYYNYLNTLFCVQTLIILTIPHNIEVWGKVLNHRLINKCQKIPSNWLNSSTCHSSWQGWGLSWE